MKKSNALMLSYMIFLAITVFAEIILNWGGLDRISIAATLAGCFFAFADLANWYISSNMQILDAFQKDTDSFLDYCNAKNASLYARRKEALDIIETITPYSGRSEHVDALISLCEERVEKLVKAEHDCRESTLNGNNELNELLNKARKKINKVSIVELVLVTAGFVVFFMLVTFDWLINLLTDYQSIATVLAFILIMLNYYLRDVLDEKTKREIEDILIGVEQQRKEAEEIKIEAQETPLLDKVLETIKEIQYLDELKEELDNE